MNRNQSLLREERLQNKNTDKLYELAKAIEPKPVGATVPERQGAGDQKAAFLADEIVNPNHAYPALIKYSIDEVSAIQELGRELVNSVDDPILKKVYQDQIDGHVLMGSMMLAMNEVKSASTQAEFDTAAETFMHFNIEKYGKPDLKTYESLLTDKARDVLSKNLGESRQVLQEELKGVLPATILRNAEEGRSVERFAPSPETVQWISEVVDSLYSDMLRHVPDQDEFTPAELVSIFQTVIEEEFGDAAQGWRAELATANAINVNAGKKLIQVPVDRGILSRDRVRALVVHEIGVHMFRSLTGGDTNIGPLATGLAGYYDVEEGLGVVMEQALSGGFKEAGVDHYISAGAAYFDGMGFREMFEMKWRLKALENLDEDGNLTDEAVAKARELAYKSVMRSLRGTDSLPWFKDLAYYNGSVEVWKHLESIRGDEFQFSLLMQGKVNTSKEHQRIVLESKSV